jgi:hypothetical protein
MRKVAVFIVFAFLVGCCFVSGVSNAIDHIPVDNNKSEKPSETPVGNPMTFQWPMRGHDAQNTCRSEYDASQNQGYEKWKYFVDDPLDSATPVIDSEGTLYIKSVSDGLYAIYPNGTLKWHCDLVGLIEYQPAIGLNGTIYVGTLKYFYAFYPNGTLQWILPMEKCYCSHPIVNPEGIIYIGTSDGYFYAVYPNGTIQWEYYLGYYLIGTSLDTEGNIYFTARYCDYFYCLNPNGTLKWRFGTIYDTHDAPLIGDDGTIYIVAVNHIVAVNPDGIEKWRTPSIGTGFSPALLPDGTIVYSSLAEDVFGLDPDDGHTRWHYQLDYNPEDKTRPVISSDGTVFFAYTDQSGEKAYMSALNPDGTLRWTASITSDIYPYDGMFLGSTPSIGADGTVYVTTWFIRGNSTYHDFGYIHAFNQLNPNAPITPTITGPPKGKVGVQHEYTFTSTSPTGKDVYYYIMWGDDTYTNWIGPFQSGEPVSVNHSWSKWGRYTIQARARDSDNLWGLWGTLEVTMPKNKGVFNDHSILSWLFERFPHAFPILRYLSDQ